MDNYTAHPVYTPSSSDRFFRRRYNTTIAFAVGVLLFLLPFTEVRCGGMTLASNSGVGLAFGSEWRVASMGKPGELLNKAGKEGEKTAKALKTGPNWLMLISLVAGVAGLGIALTSIRVRSVAALSAGALAAVLLIAAMIQLKMSMNGAMPDSEEARAMGTLIKLQFTIWYYLSLICFAAAAFFSYKQHKLEEYDAVSTAVDFDFQRRQIGREV